MKTLREMMDLIESAQTGVAEGSKQRLPIVMYKEISPDMMQGRDFYQVVQSQSPFWKVGETFSDDDMSMGSRQVRFISDTGKEQGVAEEQLEETTPDAMAKIDDLFRK